MSDWPLIRELAKQVQSGSTTALSLVQKSLSNINKYQDYKAIITTLEDSAIKKAKAIDLQIKNGKKVGELAGVPFIAKDNYLVFGSETTAASNILKGFNAPYQSTVIERLESAGAICVAKANLDAFAHGGSTENSDFFTTKNPHDKSRVPGGSSGGSATSVVLGMAPFALGTDTGGSSRQPASFSGCVGYKPTYGLMSRWGIVAMASSTDTVGILANNTQDVATVLQVMAGKDPYDGTTIERSKDDYTNIKASLKGKKIGLIKEQMGNGVEKEVLESVNNAVETLKKAGAQITDVSLPSLPLSLAVYYIVVPAEISSNLSRYDGQKYGYSAPDVKDITDSYNKSRSIGFGKEAKRRIMIGTYVLSSGYYDAYYKKAQTVRTKLINEFNDIFSKVDYLIGPTAPTVAFKIGQNTADPLQMYLSDVMTVGASLVGIPAISVPTKTKGLPVGIQIMAPQHKDKELLAVAAAFEEAR